MKTGDKVTDPSQSGLVLTNLRFGDSGNYSEFQARMLAHEIGHIILQPENEHFPDPKNLMSSSATGDELTATQFILALNYNNTKVPDSNFVIEE